MRILGLPKRFPEPQNMKDSSVTTWVTWMRDESNELIAAIDEEITKRQDPDDPFDGTASGIFLPLQHGNGVPPQQQNARQADESKNRDPQEGGPSEGRLVEIQSQGLQQKHHCTMMETGENGAALQSGVQQDIRQSDALTSQQENPTKQRKIEPHDDQSSTQATTQRQVEESHTSSLFREQQAEDPFRTLRSFHEKQRGERQWENTHHTSVTLHSMFEGAIGGVGVNHLKPQRVTKKHQPQDQPQTVTQSQQETNHSRQDNYLQGPHNTTTYMNLPNPIQNKICGRCGLMGHIKRMCRQEVYCKYCKIYTHSMTACRTYPVTSSRKNTPEK